MGDCKRVCSLRNGEHVKIEEKKRQKECKKKLKGRKDEERREQE